MKSRADGIVLALTSIAPLAKRFPELPMKTRTISRRQFVKAASASAAAAFGFTFIPSRVWGQLEKPALGAIGISGKGASDVRGAEGAGFRVAALVDVVDARKTSGAKLARNQGQLQGQYSGL